MNLLWASMIIIGVVYGGLTGNLSAVGDAAITYSKEAVTLGISMLGVMAFWMGMMEIATKAGIIEALSKKVQPLFHWLFPRIPLGSKAQEYMTTNMVANFLGLGWAATPAGLQAMEELDRIANSAKEHISNRVQSGEVNEGKYATDEMCTFLVLNISSLQLIPINIIAYRSEYGSVSPTAVLVPAIIATFISTVVGILFCKIKSKNNKL